MMTRSQRGRLACFATFDALMAAAAERFVSDAAHASRTFGRFAVALSGGSTPGRLYELLASPPYAGRVDWSRVDVFWGDERCVLPADPASNYRMAREALLDHVPVLDANVHRIRGEDVPAQAAAAYERELRRAFTMPEGPPSLAAGRRFDLVLLGMGDNGHTASLFPGLAAVREQERWVVAEHVTEVGMWRVTLTPPILNAAAHIVFLVSGAGKAAMLHRVLEGPSQPDVLPAQAITAIDGVLDWLVDAAAAARLSDDAREEMSGPEVAEPRQPLSPAPEPAPHTEEQIDDVLRDSFPASDAPPWTLGTRRRERDPVHPSGTWRVSGR